MQYRSAIILNLLAPGAGLIMLRREWLGAALALLFGVLAQVVVFGWLIVPADVPAWMVVVAGAAAAGVWGAGQWLLGRRLRLLRSPELAQELAQMRAEARRALDDGDLDEAHRTLLVALSVDDEDVELAVLWAQLMSAMGRRGDARRGWRRVLALATGESHVAAAREALGRTSSQA